MFQRAETAVTLAGVEACRGLFAECIRNSRPGQSLWVAHVDAQVRCIGLAEYAEEADPRELPVARIAADAALLGSAGLIVAQHRTGAEPFTHNKRLAEAAEVMDVPVLDHLLFTPGHCTSLRRAGLL